MIKKIISIAIFAFSITASSQKIHISPYSFFGIGEFTNAKTSFERNMAGTTTAFNSAIRFTLSNPASLSKLKLTNYLIAGENDFAVIDNGIVKQSSSFFALSYLALGFPVGEKGGASFGVKPYSKVGYAILNRYQNNINETESDLFTGNGITNRVFVSYGYQLPYQISLGVEASYIFGNQERSILHRNEEHLDRLASRYNVISDVNGFLFKIGAQHAYKIKDELELKTGLTILLENRLTNKGTETLVSLENLENPDQIVIRETLVDKTFEGEIISPIKTSLSIALGKEHKWFAGIEYGMQNALSFSNNFTQNNNTVQYGKSTVLSLGGFYIPKPESITSYWHRVTYIAGLHTKQTGLIVNNVAINDFGMSFGVSLPSNRKLSNINLGVDIGQRGEINNNGLIKENYYNFRLGLSLNDKWFKKRKLD